MVQDDMNTCTTRIVHSKINFAVTYSILKVMYALATSDSIVVVNNHSR